MTSVNMFCITVHAFRLHFLQVPKYELNLPVRAILIHPSTTCLLFPLLNYQVFRPFHLKGDLTNFPDYVIWRSLSSWGDVVWLYSWSTCSLRTPPDDTIWTATPPDVFQEIYFNTGFNAIHMFLYTLTKVEP